MKRSTLSEGPNVVIVVTSQREADATITKLTIRQFNRDMGRAKRAAAAGPVVVTDRGRPSLVLVTYEDCLQLSGNSTTIAGALTGTLDAAELEFDPVPDRDTADGHRVGLMFLLDTNVVSELRKPHLVEATPGVVHVGSGRG